VGSVSETHVCFANTDFDLCDTREYPTFPLRKFIVDIIWHNLSAFGEITNLTQADVYSILDNHCRGGLPLDEVFIVKGYGDALKDMTFFVDRKRFELNAKTMRQFWHLMTRHADSRRELDRSFEPAWDSITSGLEIFSNPLERACRAFVAIIRANLFDQASIRIASFVMYAIMSLHFVKPFLFPCHDKERFALCYKSLKHDNDASSLLEYLRELSIANKAENLQNMP